MIWGIPKIRGTLLGVPIIRHSILGSKLGSPILGNYHLGSGLQVQGLVVYGINCIGSMSSGTVVSIDTNEGIENAKKKLLDEEGF